jgi:hypothetical protein
MIAPACRSCAAPLPAHLVGFTRCTRCALLATATASPIPCTAPIPMPADDEETDESPLLTRAVEVTRWG